MNLYAINTGRILLGLYFLLPGLMKFVQWDMHVALMEKHGMVLVPILLAAAGIIQICASLMILANRFITPTALILAAMVVVINISLHDFWNYSGMEGAHELQNFVKNLGILGGLLVLAGFNYQKSNQAL
ncbi:MAG: DoxX family protein [Oleispira sp.]|nr:DoxX family protein [Oleispira sp.]